MNDTESVNTDLHYEDGYKGKRHSKKHSKKSRRRKNLIIDFDETLFSAIDFSEFDKNKHGDKLKKFESMEMDDSYIVVYRPGLQDFLDYIFDNFNVTTFTAASNSYAMFVIKNIIKADQKQRYVDNVFFSYHCDLSKKLKKGIKDLSILWDIFKLPGYNKNNVLIIDDNPDVKATGYCIQVPEFNFFDNGSENDNYLEVLKGKLEDYKNTPDSRQYEG